ncbi:hypothetical protein HQQ82_15965 [Rathayibacter sp. VKM Ac-2856]|uniref:hypothetical protein n=1 Tax=unclassified Rathayibacter TaxID=2609250 RepID=UPI001564A445|nr:MULTISPECIES: hypothetical protein [unclassified Rathayibacter]NQX06308.1 hypothetical protein [Rathayibacter sp. VKM Ac-2858]NQX21475.1 hypothetical protein [Rathayibacter sp. VKM Ac-2856]
MERRERRLRQWDEGVAAARDGLALAVSGGVVLCGVAGGGLAAALALASGGILEEAPAALRTVTALALALIAGAVLVVAAAALRRRTESAAERFARAAWPVPADLDRDDLDETADLPHDVRLPEDAVTPADLAGILAPSRAARAEARGRASLRDLRRRSALFSALSLAGLVVALVGVLLLVAVIALQGTEGAVVTAAVVVAVGAAAGIGSSQANALPIAVLRASDAALARSRRLLVERWPGDLEEGPLSVRGGVAAIDRRGLTGTARRAAPSSAGAGRVAPIVMLAVALLLVAGLPLLS